MAIGIAVDLHRIHVAVYKTSTRSTQFAWSIAIEGTYLASLLCGILVLHVGLEHRLSAREYAKLAISLTQSITGLYILYRKSLVMTQWLFYFLCVTTAYQTISANIGYWNEDFKKNFAELAETIEDDGGGAILKDFSDKTDEEVLLFPVLCMTGTTLLYLGRFWVFWRLVADPKVRNARVARAVGLI